MKKLTLAKAIPYITAVVMGAVIIFLSVSAIDKHVKYDESTSSQTEKYRQLLLDDSSFTRTKIIFQQEEWMLIKSIESDSEFCYLHTVRRHSRIGFSMVLCEHFTKLTDY